MKKTIAILLVLVIGMVGVFAVDNGTLTINATVAPVDLMGIYQFGTALPTDYSSAWNVSYNFSEDTPITTAGPHNVATLHTRSNNRGGYTVTMTASPLSSSVEGSEVVTYLGYSIEAYSGTTSYGTSTVASYQSGNGNSADIIEVEAILGAIVTQSRNLRVNIPDIVSAPAGTYSGNVTFEYLAN